MKDLYYKKFNSDKGLNELCLYIKDNELKFTGICFNDLEKEELKKLYLAMNEYYANNKINDKQQIKRMVNSTRVI